MAENSGYEAAVKGFLSTADNILSCLHTFKNATGEDAFPRAFVDIVAEISSLREMAMKSQIWLEADLLNSGKLAQLQHSFEGCVRQIQLLDTILDRCVSRSKGSSQKGTNRALKDIYNEKDIPRIQKTRLGYQATITKLIGD